MALCFRLLVCVLLMSGQYAVSGKQKTHQLQIKLCSQLSSDEFANSFFLGYFLSPPLHNQFIDEDAALATHTLLETGEDNLIMSAYRRSNDNAE